MDAQLDIVENHASDLDWVQAQIDLFLATLPPRLSQVTREYLQRLDRQRAQLEWHLPLWLGEDGSQRGIPGEHPAFFDAAMELTSRGLDSVVFGHTHHAGEVKLPNGARYFNSGSWLMGTPMVSIEDGELRLENWARDRLASKHKAPALMPRSEQNGLGMQE